MGSDRNTIVMPAECSGSFGLALAASCSERKTVEGCYSLACGAIARPTIEAVTSSSSNNAAATIPSFQSAFFPPFIEPGCFYVDDKTDQSQGSLTFPKRELISDGVTCHSLKPCQPQSDMFQVQMSETCLRRFVMFDQSGSQNRIIFHPSLVNDFPTLLQFPQNTGNCWEYMHDVSAKVLGSLKETLLSPLFLGEGPAFNTILPPSWRSALLTNREEDLFQLYDRDGCSQSQISDCLSHENSEDLEALLWSDDEMSSSGHCPRDFTRRDTQISSANCCGGYSVCSGRKRKTVEEGETESTATSKNRTSKKVLCRNSDIVGRGSGYGKESLTLFDLSLTDDASSFCSTNNQRQREWRSSAAEPIVKKKVRIEKLHDTFNILRSIIPGGESMDTALVLDEAVQFVKNLQVEVQKLEPEKAA